MATMKEYGLIFKDLSVKIVEVVVNKGMFDSLSIVGLTNELETELHNFLNENNYHPIAIIPDTALNNVNYNTTRIREATKTETKEYLIHYEDSEME